MRAKRVLQLLEDEPQNWSFNEHIAKYKPTNHKIWTGNGLLFIDFYPSNTGAFNLYEKWLIKCAINRAKGITFGVSNEKSKLDST